MTAQERTVRRWWTVKEYLRPHFVSRDQPQVVLADEHDSLVRELREELAAVRKAADALMQALCAMRTMRDYGPKPRKLDEALTWRANDELAESMAIAAIQEYAAYRAATQAGEAKET